MMLSVYEGRSLFRNSVCVRAIAFLLVLVAGGSLADQLGGSGQLSEPLGVGGGLKLSATLDTASSRVPVSREVAASSRVAQVSRPMRLALASQVSTGEADVASRRTAKLGIEELFQLAAQTHPEVAARRAELEAALANRDAARWQYFPTPSLQVRQQDKGGSVTVAALQQPVWSGGRLDAGFDAADSRVRSASVAISEAQYALALRVTGVWQTYIQARGRVEALDRGVALLSVYVESVRRRIKGGVSPEVDRELVESRFAQAEGDLAAARATERSALLQLSQLIGRSVQPNELSAPDRVADKVLAFEVLTEQSVSSSATLRRIEAEMEAAQHDSTQKRAVLWPTLGVRAEYQRGDVSNIGVDTSDSRVMLVLDYVPGAGLSAAAGVDAAEARVASLRSGLEGARRDLVSKIAVDYEDQRSSRVREQDMQRTLRSASEVLASYDRLFVAGKRSWLDVINAARELTQIELSIADIRALLAASYYRLRLHSGEITWQSKDGGGA